MPEIAPIVQTVLQQQLDQLRGAAAMFDQQRADYLAAADMAGEQAAAAAASADELQAAIEQLGLQLPDPEPAPEIPPADEPAPEQPADELFGDAADDAVYAGEPAPETPAP